MCNFETLKLSIAWPVLINVATHRVRTKINCAIFDSLSQASVENSQSSHPAAIVVPVLLLVLIVALAATWQIRREFY